MAADEKTRMKIFKKRYVHVLLAIETPLRA